jgi:hypothetical protein
MAMAPVAVATSRVGGFGSGPGFADAVRSWADDALLAEQAAIATERRLLDARAAVIAGEIARRSEAGDGSGLAARQHARTAVDLVQRLTGGTVGEARALVAIGRSAEGDEPWMRPISEAVTTGRLSVLAAGAIRSGLVDAGGGAGAGVGGGGGTDTGIPASALVAAAERLVDDALRVPVERLAARARAERDLLDERGVAEREAARRERRFLRLIPLDDGMTRLVGLLDTESAARVRSAFDQVTAPRRSGPRFVADDARATARSVADDPRTTEQLLLDRFVDMVELAVSADEGAIFGARRPGLRVHVALRDLQSGSGAAQMEGSADAVSVATAQRVACSEGVLPILFDTAGEPLDVGRTQRLHTTRQRIAIAARDGGCRWLDCDRPPSWTEVHHPIPWSRGGSTSVENGISLCAFHHLLAHNEGWRIEREGAEYWLLPPPGRGASGERIALPSRNRIRT